MWNIENSRRPRFFDLDKVQSCLVKLSINKKIQILGCFFELTYRQSHCYFSQQNAFQNQNININVQINIQNNIMQSTLDINLSSAWFRDQAARQARTRKNLNEEHQIAQLKTQNQLNSKHGSIRFKPAISQNRLFLIQKVDIYIQKQFVQRHYLPQYIADEKYVKFEFGFNFQKFFDSTLRFIFDVFKFDNIFVFKRHLYMTYEKQIEQ